MGIAHAARIGVVARNDPALIATLLFLIAVGHSVVMIYAWQWPGALAEEVGRLDLDAFIAEVDCLPAPPL